MKQKLTWFAAGFVVGAVALAAVGAVLLLAGVRSEPIFHQQRLPSGRVVKVTSFNLAWGVEHDARRPGDDSLVLEYVSGKGDLAELDRETLEVFELMKPVSELWGFREATISAFPALDRKGTYQVYTFTRPAAGTWTFSRKAAKVHVTD